LLPMCGDYLDCQPFFVFRLLIIGVPEAGLKSFEAPPGRKHTYFIGFCCFFLPIDE
jgi:hypothetical protein